MLTKTALITGATSGIGKACSMGLGREGFNLIITGRNEKEGNKIARKVKTKYGVNVNFLKADISSISEVNALCDKIKNKYDNIDVLVNNAGARYQHYQKSIDGIELTFATNYLGHFALTLSLLDLMKHVQGARIINVSSSAHWKASIDIDDIKNPKNYDRRTAYGQSKLAIILFTYEISRRLKGTNITVNAMDPGGVATNLGRNDGLISWAKHYIFYLSKRTLISPSKAAKAIVYLSTSKDVENTSGKYYFRKDISKSSALSYNNKLGEELWNLSSNITGSTFN